MVAMDDGTYALTDEHGRYHFPAALPGQRLIKLNAASLPNGSRVLDRATRVLALTPGLLATADFGVALEQRTLTLDGAPDEHGGPAPPASKRLTQYLKVVPTGGLP